MNVLILPLYGLGDTLMTTPAVEILKRATNFKITYICMFRGNFGILKKNPFIDELIYYPFMERSKLEVLSFIFSHRGKFEYSINFYPSNRWQYNLLSFLFSAKFRIGHRYLKSDLIGLNFLKNLTLMEDEELHNVEENIRLLSLLDIKTEQIPPMRIYLDKEELHSGAKFIHINSERDIRVGVHTGTSSLKGHIKRRWGKEKFLDLINSFPDFDFFLFGTKEEEAENRYIFDGSKHRNVILIEAKSIREVAAIMTPMDLFISNDSGLMHLAAALNIPVVAIFGPTNPKWVRPWGVKSEVVRINLPCSPCFYYSPKPLECKNRIAFECLKNIEVSMVKEAVERLVQYS